MTTRQNTEMSGYERDSRPVPDPTLLTTQQLWREVASIKELFLEKFTAFGSRVDAIEASFNNRMRESEMLRTETLNKASQTIQVGVDKAERQLQVSLDRAQSELRESLAATETRVNEKFTNKDQMMDDKVEHLRSLHDEKFKSVSIQFVERDTRTEQTSRDSKVAVDAALQAAKEAVGEQTKSSNLSNSKMEVTFTKQLDQIGTIINTTTGGLNDKIDGIKERLALVESRPTGAGRDYVGQVLSLVAIIGVVAVAVVMLLRH